MQPHQLGAAYRHERDVGQFLNRKRRSPLDRSIDSMVVKFALFTAKKREHLYRDKRLRSDKAAVQAISM